MSNRYPGYCADCQAEVGPGHGTLKKERGRWVVRCGNHASAADPAPRETTEDAPHKISRSSGYGGKPYQVDHVYRNYKDATPEWLYCLRTAQQYVAEDGLSFGVGDESGYIYTAVCRAATDEEIAPVLARIAVHEKREQAVRDLRSLERRFATEGEHPGGDNTVDGDRLLDTQNIYGGGSWWIVQPDAIWYIRNNGADGDDWRANNVRTGGAGAIGYRLPHTAELEAELRGLAAIVGEAATP